MEEAFQQKWRLSLSMKISGGLSTFRESTHQLGNEYCSYQPGSQVQGSEVLSRFTQLTPSCAKETNIITTLEIGGHIPEYFKKSLFFA